MSDNFNRIKQTLRDAGYLWMGAVDPAWHDDVRMERWVSSKGVVIITWDRDGGGVQTFADWPLGTTFEEFEKAIK